MSTFPTSLFLYNPKDKKNKSVLRNEIGCFCGHRIPKAINSFFLRKSCYFMWIVTAKEENGYQWVLHRPLEQSFKKLEVYNVTNDL